MFGRKNKRIASLRKKFEGIQIHYLNGMDDYERYCMASAYANLDDEIMAPFRDPYAFSATQWEGIGKGLAQLGRNAVAFAHIGGELHRDGTMAGVEVIGMLALKSAAYSDGGEEAQRLVTDISKFEMLLATSLEQGE